MKRLFAIAMTALLAFAGCSKNEDLLPEQQSKIVSYLTGSHSPRLLSEADARESLEEDPPYYTMAGGTAYRYIEDIYNPERATRRMVEWGDALTITYRAHLFSGSSPDTGNLPFMSNDPALEEAYIEKGLNPEYWSFEPLRIVLGETQIIKGLEVSLAGCCEGDRVEVYMTYNMAYDDRVISTVPKESALVFYFTVDSVEKKQ